MPYIHEGKLVDGDRVAMERLKRERELRWELAVERLPEAEWPPGSCGWWDPDEEGGGA